MDAQPIPTLDEALAAAQLLGGEAAGVVIRYLQTEHVRHITIRSEAVAEIRAADAEISERALEDEFRIWYNQRYGISPRFQRRHSIHPPEGMMPWSRHLLRRGVSQ